MFKLNVVVFACLLIGSSICKDGVVPREAISTDFENGLSYPWFDSSPSDVHWVVEDYDSPVEPTQAPRPSSGTKFLRAYRGTSGTAFGLAVLSSPYFTALPGDKIVLNYWIRSQHTGGNSLEVYYYQNGTEERILDLNMFSSPSNFEWRLASAVIPISEPTDMRLIIYGYCGGLLQDAIAIDDIVVSRPSDITGTTTETSYTTTDVASSSEAASSTNQPSSTTYRTTPHSTSTTPRPTGNCSYILTEPNGQIKSPNYPSNYFSHANCTWLVELQLPYTKVKFDFVAFTTEYCCDRLKIYDGETESSALLLQHQGASLPSPPSVTSSGPSVLLTFTSDYSIERSGFWLEYSGVFLAGS